MKPLLSIFVFVVVLGAVWLKGGGSDTFKFLGDGAPDRGILSNNTEGNTSVKREVPLYFASEAPSRRLPQAAVPKVMPPASDVKLPGSGMPSIANSSKVLPGSNLEGLSEFPQITGLEPNGYLARILLNSPEDVNKALLRAEALFRSGKVSSDDSPIAFVLHGPEVKIFFQDNYEQYQPIVDLAAKLTAFNVVDVKVCRTRMRVVGRRESALVPFVGTVPYGPAEIKRLVDKEEYVYF